MLSFCVLLSHVYPFMPFPTLFSEPCSEQCWLSGQDWGSQDCSSVSASVLLNPFFLLCWLECCNVSSFCQVCVVLLYMVRRLGNMGRCSWSWCLCSTVSAICSSSDQAVSFSKPRDRHCFYTKPVCNCNTRCQRLQVSQEYHEQTCQR